VELNEVKYGQGKVVHYMNSINWNRLDEVPKMVNKVKMMNKLKQFCQGRGSEISEHIDSIQWNVDKLRTDGGMWQILNGLSDTGA